jgi:integrase
VNHQILRRTFASLTYNTGGDLKDIQAQLRHSSVNTTANVHTKPIPQSVKDAVEALDPEIRQVPSGKLGDRRKR